MLRGALASEGGQRWLCAGCLSPAGVFALAACWLPRPRRVISTACVLAASASQGYWHWLRAGCLSTAAFPALAARWLPRPCRILALAASRLPQPCRILSTGCAPAASALQMARCRKEWQGLTRRGGVSQLRLVCISRMAGCHSEWQLDATVNCS